MIGASTSVDLTAAETEVFGASAPLGRPGRTREVSNLSWVPLLTLILWGGCLGIGVLGLVLHYRYPQLAPRPVPIQAEILNVELTHDPLPPPDVSAPPPPTPAPPPLSVPVVPPQAPPMAAVAEPVAPIAFALPVEAPVTVTEAKQAAAHAVVAPGPAPAPAPAVQTLTHGYGEGKQPAPIYPVRALREGQEGTVRVRFSVGENGRVLSAEASAPSPWSLLNQEAVRVVRERWRFRPGSLRLFEVSIRFELQK